MKHIPILFSTEMVQAILEGRKKMTRRILPIQPLDDDKWILATLVGGDNKNIGKKHWVTMKNPYTIDRYDDRYFTQKYSIGDILWVRESFIKSEFATDLFYYKTDKGVSGKWRPSIHMPKEACRIFLKVTDVRVERLHEITEQDAVDEGIFDMWSNVYDKKDNLHAYLKYDVTRKEQMEPGGHWAHVADDAVHSFRSLWAKINGQSSWDANLWVWVISFERCDRPSDFLNPINK